MRNRDGSSVALKASVTARRLILTNKSVQRLRRVRAYDGVMATTSWAGHCRAVLGVFALAQGCGQVSADSPEAQGGADSPAQNDNAGSPSDTGGKGPSEGGKTQGGFSSGGEPRGDAGTGEPSHGGARDGGAAGDSVGASGEGGAGEGGVGEGGAGEGGAGDGGAGGAIEVPVDIEECLAGLVGPVDKDIISVRGRAGALGAVDYTIAGYSAGASGLDGLQRFTNGYYGQVGTPAGISDTGLWMWTQNGPVVIGKVYTSGYYVPGGAQLNFRILADSYSTGVSCPNWGSGHFVFTQFQVGSLLATGGYDFQCPEADIDVSGCFRYTF